MKRFVFVMTLLSISVLMHAQVSKTVHCTAGALSGLLTATEKNTVTSLTLTGTVDARDFKIMRDSMAVLSDINMSGVSVLAYSGASGTLTYSNTYPENTIPACAFDKNTVSTKLKSFVFPTSITSIGSRAFYGSNMTLLDLPSGLLKIDDSAFMSNSKLTAIYIPASVTNIESSSVFAYCKGDITVDESNPDYSSADGVLFDKNQTILLHCPASKTGSYTIPSTVTVLANYAFANCLYLTSVSIPTQVTSIGYYAFYQCQKLAGLVLPPNITSIGESTFSMCYKLTSLVIPPKVTSIGRYALSVCNGLTTLTIPSTVTSIGSSAFSNCSKLTSLYVKSSVPVDLSTVVSVFSGINKTSCLLYVPYKTKDLYSDETQWSDFINIIEQPGFFLPDLRADLMAAAGSSDSIPVYADVSWTVDEDAQWLTVNPSTGSGDRKIVFTASANPEFYDREATVTILSSGVPSQTIRVIQYGIPRTFTVSAGTLTSVLSNEEKLTVSNLKLVGTLDARDFKLLRDSVALLSCLDLSEATILDYSGTQGTSGTTYIIYPANKLPDYAFCVPGSLAGKGTLNVAVLPPNLTVVGKYAFYGCKNLAQIELPPLVTTISDYSFYGCKSLNAFNIPAAVTSIGQYTFYGCTGLISVGNSSSATSIGNYAFSECRNLTSFLLPESLKSLGIYAFSNCKSLDSITVPSATTTLGSNAFRGCAHLKSAAILSPISSLPLSLFYGCNDLSAFTIPATVKTIESSAFSYCRSLTSITFPPSVSSISTSAFSYCSGLTTLEIPSTITSLGAYCFNNCSGLTTVNLPVTLTILSDYLFSNCTSLDSLVIPSSIKTIGAHALQDCNFKTIDVPTSVTTVGDYAFASNTLLTSVNIPNSVTSIGTYTFSWCTSLPTVVIPEKVTRFEASLFSWATGLTSITIPSSVSYIGSLAFYMCSRLTSIKCEQPEPIGLELSSQVFQGVNKTTCILYVPFGSKAAYRAANQWKDFQNIVEMPGLEVDTVAQVGPQSGSRDSVFISSNTGWRAGSDVAWLTVTPSSGRGSDTLLLIAERNPTTSIRTALVTISGDSIESRTITVVQDAGSGSSVPEQYALTDSTVLSGEINCFNAYDSVTVAGDGLPVDIQNGAVVDFIAGHSIRFLPGFHAGEGSTVNARITTDSSFCDGAEAPLVQSYPTEKSGSIITDLNTGSEPVSTKTLRIYPNPNSGQFTIELPEAEPGALILVTDPSGKTLYRGCADGTPSMAIDLADKTPGLRLVRLAGKNGPVVFKMLVR